MRVTAKRILQLLEGELVIDKEQLAYLKRSKADAVIPYWQGLVDGGEHILHLIKAEREKRDVVD